MKRFLYLLSILSLLFPIVLHVIGGFDFQVYVLCWYLSFSFMIGCILEFIEQTKKK